MPALYQLIVVVHFDPLYIETTIGSVEWADGRKFGGIFTGFRAVGTEHAPALTGSQPTIGSVGPFPDGASTGIRPRRG